MKKLPGKPEWQKKIAKERIEELFKQAQEQFSKHPDLSDRYVKIARNISMRYKLPIQRELKRRFCKNCYKYLVPGRNCRVRIAKHRVIYQCSECRHYMRYVLNT